MKYIKNDYLVRKYKKVREDKKMTYDEFYKKIGDTFKKSYPNTLAWLISSDLDAMKKVGLRPSRRIKLYNGKLECRFLQFEMYEGTKKIHKLEGK